MNDAATIDVPDWMNPDFTYQAIYNKEAGRWEFIAF